MVLIRNFIVALVGIESAFGKVKGKYRVIDTLSTLAYEGRRKVFFEKELFDALMILKLEGMTIDDYRGSWAGASGICQFMPSTFLTYAVDFDRGRQEESMELHA